MSKSELHTTVDAHRRSIQLVLNEAAVLSFYIHFYIVINSRSNYIDPATVNWTDENFQANAGVGTVQLRSNKVHL